MGEQSRRLDSWKEIAEYLGRDVRTAMRWAKTHGLPVRRVAGGKGRSVFAFTAEIDNWLAGEPEAASNVAPGAATAPPPRRRRAMVPLLLPAAAGLGLIIALGTLREGSTARTPLRAVIADRDIFVVTPDGARRAIHTFDADEQVHAANAPPAVADLDGDGDPEITAAVSYFLGSRARAPRSGEVLSLSPEGSLRWRFTFDDRVTFRERTFAGPWVLTDWQIEPAGTRPRIAAAAHDHNWWPSVVVVLDPAGGRLHTFVNPGWIESVLWLDVNRLAVGGFNNARDAAALAILDPSVRSALAPGAERSPFDCQSCSGDAPLFYATFPRSELNRLTGNRFNRAAIVRHANRVIVTTAELAGESFAASAIYEFDDTTYALTSARFNDQYWDAHRRLELEGRIAHSRQTCPERNGPAFIQIWDGSGWRSLSTTN